ncbi:MAG: hypothetical protein KatS3mg104_3195 [Phycisphaerae bacterium]|nr:MAG: hypothetical protein KatS3mg104_3195 [Phycisphaerae bacterium]
MTMAKKKPVSDRIVPVGITQMACVEDPVVNRRKQAELLEQAARQGAKILCTQEMFASLYFCQCEDHRFFKLAETIPGPSTDLFGKIARKYKATIVASLFEKRASGLYHNTAAVIAPDGEVQGIYRKMHIPDDPLYYEKFYFTPGGYGFSGVGYTLRQDRGFGLLGSMVSRRGASNCPSRSRDPVLSHCDRLASC